MVHHWPLIWYCTVLINLSLTALKLIKVPSRSLSVKTQSRHEYFPQLRDIYIKHRIPKIVPSKQLHKDPPSLLLAMIDCDIYVQWGSHKHGREILYWLRRSCDMNIISCDFSIIIQVTYHMIYSKLIWKGQGFVKLRTHTVTRLYAVLQLGKKKFYSSSWRPMRNF